jgi:subtilisin family serine protease
MRELEARLADLLRIVEQEVEVERPRALGRPGRPVPPEPGLDGEQEVEEVPWGELGPELSCPVEEARLVEIPDRLGLLERRDGDHLHPVRAVQLGNGRANRGLAVAEVRAQRDERSRHELPRYPGVLARRLLAVVVAALALCGAAAAAGVRVTTDPLEPQEWWLGAIGANVAQSPGPGVPITIVDSGTDPTHPEFANRPNTTFFDAQSVLGPGEFHGTMVASVAAAPENGVGMAGVYPNAALQVFDASPTPQGITDPTAIAGILTAAQHCPGVINLSFGGVQDDFRLHAAILQAYDAGCLVVAAAGNDGQLGDPPTFPADWPHVLTVAASDRNNAVAPFSTVSPANDITAPGVGIIGAVPLSHDPSGYITGDGTSFAAPIVSAAAAWIWTLRPTLTAGQLAGVLRESATDIGPPGFDNASGYGLLNIPAALVAPAPPIDPDEPNDDIDEVRPLQLFQLGQPPLTTKAKPATRIAATLDTADDPTDVYRIWVPAHRTVRVSVSSGGRAAARIWGPKTVSLEEGVALRRRDLRGPSITAGKTGMSAYVEVLPTGRSNTASYVLNVTASKR